MFFYAVGVFTCLAFAGALILAVIVVCSEMIADKFRARDRENWTKGYRAGLAQAAQAAEAKAIEAE